MEECRDNIEKENIIAKEHDLISIIVPVYNVEKYLDRCISSIVNQTYKHLEIILVDDGSPDGCPYKCDEWAKKDKRIKVIHKKNEGLGLARNSGLEKATGKYICFFDSDDYIRNDTIEKCYSAALRETADIVCFGIYLVDCYGNIVEEQIPQVKKNIYLNSEIQNDLLKNMLIGNANEKSNNLLMSAWSAFYSMEYITSINWKFVSERAIISEDVYSMLRFYRYAQKAVILQDAFYYYCENSNSLTRTFRNDRIEKIKYFYFESKEECKRLKYSEDIQNDIAYPAVSNLISAMKHILSMDASIVEKYTNINNIIRDQDIQDCFTKIDSKSAKKTRKILYYFIKHRMVCFCYILLLLKK